MFLGVVTNQEIVDVLQSLNNKSILETMISVITPVAASIITLWISNKHSEEQLKIQMKAERQKIIDDRDLQLKIEEKKSVDKQIIEHLAEISGSLYPALEGEVFFNSKKIYAYYKAVKKGADKEKEKEKLRKTYEASGKLHRSRQLRINILIAFAPEKLRKKYKKLTKEMLNFEYGAVYNQYTLIYGDNWHDSTYPEYSEDDFIRRYDYFINELIGLIEGVQRELENSIDQARYMEKQLSN